MSDDAWANFIAQLDPAAVEAERFRPPGDDERPGSVTDQRMRTAHAFLASDYWDRVRAGHPLPLTDDEWAARRAAQYADAEAEIERRGFNQPDIEAAIRSYSQNRAAAAAHPRGQAA
ncbi:hypothetical protein [Curtobacterium sp. DN_7.5]|uniref:hypothetical protein n=1 Tax=Curtobacterium sp. DN_7.5 TaxID=3049047 RepID=UPI001F55E01F|nr:hypothetical protein [Curtobacterium sp. DN_7.5]